MWFILLIVLIVLALGGGGWGQSRYGYVSWSPAAVVLLIAAILVFTGKVSWHG